jgi:hypothetical protein
MPPGTPGSRDAASHSAPEIAMAKLAVIAIGCSSLIKGERHQEK